MTRVLPFDLLQELIALFQDRVSHKRKEMLARQLVFKVSAADHLRPLKVNYTQYKVPFENFLLPSMKWGACTGVQLPL